MKLIDVSGEREGQPVTPLDVTGEKGRAASDAYRRHWGKGRVSQSRL